MEEEKPSEIKKMERVPLVALRTVSKLMTFELTPELMIVKVVNNIRREYVLSPTRQLSDDGLPQFSAIDAIRVNADLEAY